MLHVERNVNFPCHMAMSYVDRLKDALMSPVEFKKYHMSCPSHIIFMSLGSLSHVNFKKCPFRI